MIGPVAIPPTNKPSDRPLKSHETSPTVDPTLLARVRRVGPWIDIKRPWKNNPLFKLGQKRPNDLKLKTNRSSVLVNGIILMCGLYFV